MFTEADIDTVGHMLEEKGLSHSQIDSYFEHHGVKGMKWGVRREQKRAAYAKAVATRKSSPYVKNVTAQRQLVIDAQRKTASGTATLGERFISDYFGQGYGLGMLGPVARFNLKQGQWYQKKVREGKFHLSDKFDLMNGIDSTKLNYTYKKPVKR